MNEELTVYVITSGEEKKVALLFHFKIMLPMHIFITEQHTQQTKQNNNSSGVKNVSVYFGSVYPLTT